MPGWVLRYARPVLAVYWLCLTIGTHWPNLLVLPPEGEPHPLAAILKIDIPMHMLGFGGLMLLLILAGLGGRDKPWAKRCKTALTIGLIYMVLDEFAQAFVPGRSVSLDDFVNNAIAMLAVYIIALLPPRREPVPAPRWLVPSLVIGLPILVLLALSPWVMDRLLDLQGLVMHRRTARQLPLDHIGHGVVAAVVAVAVIVAWPMASRRPRPAALLALMVLVLAGPGVEVAQYFTGRGVEAADMVAHEIGVLLAMIWWAARLTASPELRRPASEPTGMSEHETTRDDTAAEPTEGEPDGGDARPRFVGHAVLVSVMTLLSRFAGLARDAVLAAALGLSVAADAFFIGFLVPNLFRRLFGEGALTAAFIPNYTDLLERDPSLAKRFATLTLSLLLVLLASITLVAELVLWWVAAGLDPDHKASLAVYYTRIMLPYMPLICLVALVGGVLQVHKRFGPPAAAPLVLNGVVIAAVLLATGAFSNNASAATVATWVAVGVLVAGLLQLIWQAAVLLKVTGLARSFVGTWPTMKSMLIMMGPMVLGLAVFQINALLDALIAFFFAPPDGGDTGSVTMLGNTFDAPLRNGDVAALSWSQRLYQFPLGVFGIAIATAIFPALSAAAAKFADKDGGKPRASEDFAQIVRHGLRLTVFIGLPASIGLILVAVPLARTVFEHGTFDTDDALRVSVILTGYAASVWAYSMTHTLTRAFYALKDATTPLKVSAAMVTLNLALNLTLIWPLGAAGLAWSTAISAAGQVCLLLLLIRRRVPTPIDKSVTASWGRTALASAAMAAVLLPITLLADPAGLGWWASAGVLAGMVALGAGVVFAVARFTGAEELDWLRRRSVK